jgi:CubicO group peptidase (beta-lactamase class C family)
MSILMRIMRSLAIACVLATTVGSSFAAELARAEPGEIGLSSERLARISAVIDEKIARSEFPGAVLLIARHGKIGYLESLGDLDPGRGKPMPADAIFRIYSMSKPITTAAALALFEDGRISVDDPVSKYLPQFKELRVIADSAALTEEDPGKWATVPVARPITIQDLMRHTSGLAYGFPYRTAVQRLYARAKLWDDQLTNAEFVAKIAQLPLAHQPGTSWEYSYSTDVLGRVIEVVSGKTLLEFEQERILGPLGMKDTGFVAADRAQHARIAEPFAGDRNFGRDAGAIAFYDPRMPKRSESGGAGMVSTALDYARFLQMLLNGGTFDGQRILGSKTVAYMTADHLGSEITPGPLPGYGWSLGFAVRREAGVSSMQGSLGDYFWFSAGGGSFWGDPKEDMLVIFMTYKPANMEHYQELMRQMVYAAIVR